jgi:hypothetical protein
MVFLPVWTLPPEGREGVSCCLDWQDVSALANNKTATFAGRCSEKAYRVERSARQSPLSGVLK